MRSSHVDPASITDARRAPAPRTPLRGGADRASLAAGALTGVAALAVGELVAAMRPSARSPVAGPGRALIDATPGPVIDVGVALVG